MKITYDCKFDKKDLSKEDLNNYDFDFLLLYKLSEVKLIPFSEYNSLDDEVVEARFFDEKKELRIFDYNGEKKACLIEDEENDVINEYSRRIKGNFGYKKLKIKEYINFDDDGQAYVEAIRLCMAE